MFCQSSNSQQSSKPKTSHTSIEEQCHSALNRYFHYTQFRPHQLNVIINTLRGNDSFVNMATGSGKSLCYQLPPLMCGKPCVVISPLISLMDDQVSALHKRGINAVALHSHINGTKAYDDALAGKHLLIYMYVCDVLFPLIKIQKLQV